MEQRKYSFKEIQKISRLSPATLQSLMEQNKSCINLEVVKLPSGEEEVYLDKISFERLMFLKQVQLYQEMTEGDVVELLRIPAFASLFGGTGELALGASLDSIAVEMRELQGSLNDIAVKYRDLNRELSHARVENARLIRENELLRSSRHVILAGFNTRNDGENEPPTPGVLN